MSVFADSFSQAIQELLGRSSGPLHMRLLLQPTVAGILAIKAGLRDAKAGDPPFLWTVVTKSDARKPLMRSAWKDISKLFIIALVLDTIYQYVVLKEFRILQTLIVAIVVAVLPYSLLRGVVTRIARGARG